MVAVTEEEAIRAFLTFLQALPANIVLVSPPGFFSWCLTIVTVVQVCMDEATVAALVAKVEAVDRAGLEGRVVGYSWWSRVLVYPSTPTRVATRAALTRRLDLEDWWSTTFPLSPLPTLRTARVVARAMAQAVAEVARRAGTTPSCGRFVARVGIEMAVRPSEGERRGVEEGRELLIIVNSFKPDTVTSFTVDKMDTVNIESDDEEVQLEERIEAVKRVKEEANNNEETILISSESEDSRLGSDSEEGEIQDISCCAMVDSESSRESNIPTSSGGAGSSRGGDAQHSLGEISHSI